MGKPVIEKSGVYQDFDLKEMFGPDVTVTRELREAVGQAIIDKIRGRTENGKAIGGTRSFAAYDPDYVESLAFKAAGKSEDQINLTQSGDLLSLMDIVQQSDSRIRIGWEDELQNLKAFNHNTGDTVKKRAFFGLNETETKELAKEMKPAVRSLSSDDSSAFTRRALAFLDRLEGGED